MSNRKDDVEDTVEEAPVEVQRIRKEMLAKIVGQGGPEVDAVLGTVAAGGIVARKGSDAAAQAAGRCVHMLHSWRVIDKKRRYSQPEKVILII